MAESVTAAVVVATAGLAIDLSRTTAAPISEPVGFLTNAPLPVLNADTTVISEG